MTTIVARKGVSSVEFGWESQTTWGGRAFLDSGKVFQRGDVTFGVAGLGRVSDVLRFMDLPDRDPRVDVEHWISAVFVPKFNDELKRLNVSYLSDGQTDSESNVLVLVGNTLGYLSGNLSFVKDETDVFAVGSGSPYALGALAAGASVKRSVEVAVGLDLFSGGSVNSLVVKF